MYKLLFVGGNFDKENGRPSRLIEKIYLELLKYPALKTALRNGGNIKELHNEILPSVIDYDIVMWFANVSNDEIKIRDVKAINPKTILINSKRNDNNKYTFSELISKSLSVKANLTIEFSKEDRAFNMMLFDPLGNVFYNGVEYEKMASALISRTLELLRFTRVPSFRNTESQAPKVPAETDFFNFAHECAEIFHNLIRPSKGTERFLGNMSFRCQNGFPSFRGDNGIIYVSRRNVEKSNIDENSFVPTYLDANESVWYFGEHKPSVDTPIQLRLYKLFPWANYMLHAHCFVDVAPQPNIMVYSTAHPIPCGALEEVSEIIETVSDIQAINNNPPNLIAINLAGHGCILIASDISAFNHLKGNNNSFIEREIPNFLYK